MLSTTAAATLALALSGLASARSEPNRMRAVVEGRDDWASLDHCPGGSIGDADKCTYEVLTVYDTPVTRWTQYGDWVDACNTKAGITQTVSSSLAVGNSLTVGTSISIGFESEGLSAGISESFEQSWSTTDTYTTQQEIEVEEGEAGCINVNNKFFVSEGRVRVQYGSTKGGHYYWYNYNEVFTLDTSSPDVYTSNVLSCPAAPAASGSYWYSNADMEAVKAGGKTDYTYDN